MTMVPARPLRYTLAAVYLYGAAVHVANITGHGGFDWSAAPLRWQVLDVAYLALDIAVVTGLLFRPALGLVAFAIAASSQILLYTVFRGWVLDVPVAFAPSPGERAYLDALVAFHVLSLALVVADAAYRRRRRRTVDRVRTA